MYGAIAVNGMSKMLAKYYLPKRLVPRDKGENKPTASNKPLSIPLFDHANLEPAARL